MAIAMANSHCLTISTTSTAIITGRKNNPEIVEFRLTSMRIAIIFLLFSLTVSAQDAYKNIYSAHAWKERDRWQKPDDLIKLLKISAGSQTADIGCHEGYMTFKLSKIVGASGKVYAVDVEDSKVKKVESLATESKITNITAIKGDYDNPKLPFNSLDAVIILDTYHEMDDHEEILQHILKALKPGGRLLLCEPIAESRRNSKRSEQEGKHELGMNFALEDLKKAGFKISFQKDPYVDRTKEKGDKMWVVLAEKSQ
jgi:ubiquinone/menaquinone biosynthesis C-methylase UbiE